MSSVKKCMLGLAAGAAVFGSVAQAAPTLVVDQQSQPIQTPVSPAVGFSYVPTPNGTKSTLSVYTEGFLFCGNPGGGNTTEAKLEVKHQDKTLNPAAEWKFAVADDMPAISYTGELLSLNAHQDRSLTCLSAFADGRVTSATRQGIFDNGYDSATAANYNHLVNWIAPAGFDWNAPDWESVPADPCTQTENDPARVEEDVTCAALTGVRPPAETGAPAVRAGSMWTANNFVNFTYVFRVDARFGPQTSTIPTQMEFPQTQAANGPMAANQATLMVYDAFDSTFLQSTGQACFLTALPAVLNSNVCAGAPAIALSEGDGMLKQLVVVGVPPVAQAASSFYIAVTRPIQPGAGHGSITTPVVAASILLEGAVAREGGDKFSGDNIAFGFQPTQGAGFSWMKEQ